MRERIQTHAYLNGVASSKRLYTLLFWEAVGVLPPPDCCPDFEPLKCCLSQQEMAKRLGLSRSTVREDLRRLVLHGWVKGSKAEYGIGSRRGHDYYLHADVAALEVTGVPKLVSNAVLLLSSQTRKKEDADRVGRGINRKWRPD